MSIPTAQQSLYEQLGGKPAVEAAVDLFYSKVLADNRINHYFANIDMGKQIGMQRAENQATKVFRKKEIVCGGGGWQRMRVVSLGGRGESGQPVCWCGNGLWRGLWMWVLAGSKESSLGHGACARVRDGCSCRNGGRVSGGCGLGCGKRERGLGQLAQYVARQW